LMNPAAPMAPRCPGRSLSRRDFLSAMAGALSLAAPSSIGAPAAGGAQRVPRAPTALGFCRRYEYAEVRDALVRMLDQVGDVGRLVRRKRVLVKVNLVNSSEADV